METDKFKDFQKVAVTILALAGLTLILAAAWAFLLKDLDNGCQVVADQRQAIAWTYQEGEGCIFITQDMETHRIANEALP